MTYLKSLFFNFLVVFFANYILPGIAVVAPTRLPHIGGDLMFAFGLGLLNSLVFPILRLLNRANLGRIVLVASVITFASYAILKLANLGIAVLTLEGYLMASIIVASGSILTNYLELRHSFPRAPRPPPEPPLL